MIITLHIETVSEANTHTHWRERQRRAKAQRQAAGFAVLQAIRSASSEPIEMPLRVTLVRISPRQLDGDNLQGALKHVRDGVADAIGVDDRDRRYTWNYAQESARQKGVRIVIEQGDA